MRQNGVGHGCVQTQHGVRPRCYASVPGTFQYTRGACAPPLIVGTPLYTHSAELLTKCWAYPLRTRGVWDLTLVLGTRGAWAHPSTHEALGLLS
jgi:hypothetical protein